MYAETLIEYESDLLQHADMHKTETLGEMQAFVASLGHTREEGMEPEAPRFFDDRPFQCAADPLATVRGAT